MLATILIIFVILMLAGALPRWPHSRGWGYYPSSGLGIVLVILIILLLTRLSGFEGVVNHKPLLINEYP
jgi:MFS superfamily sulfate permease-like transporter